MTEPDRRPGPTRLIAALVFVVLVVGGILLLRGTPEPAAVAPAAPAALPVEAPPAPAPAVRQPLRRGDLLAAVRSAADAAAAGRPMPAPVAALEGQSFRLSLPFGCDGPAPEGSEAPLSWRIDPAGPTLKASVRPVRFQQPWLTGGDAAIDLVEGFWIERPWTEDAACPPRGRADGVVALPDPQTVGIAVFHRADEPRARRRDGRAYEASATLADGMATPSDGLRLVLQGRIVAAPGGAPVLCSADRPDRRPLCIIAAKIDRTAIERPDGTVLGQWTP